MHKLATALMIAASPFLTAFGTGDPWDDLEGEWAVDNHENCDGQLSLEFTFDYKRDHRGEVIHQSEQMQVRRHRLASVHRAGRVEERANVHADVALEGDGTRLVVRMRRATLLPFNDYGSVIFEIADENTLLEVGTDDDGERLLRALSGTPVRLVRCEAD